MIHRQFRLNIFCFYFVCFPNVNPSKCVTMFHRLHCKVRDLNFFSLEKGSLGK